MHVLLEKLDQYLWVPRPPALAPELVGVHQREGAWSTPPTQLPSVGAYLEDGATHWGVHISNRYPTEETPG